MKFGIEDKEKLCKNEPCQPPESILSERKKKIGEHNRYCSQVVFFHEDQTRCKWLSYSLSKDCLFCLPCLLFSDECLRGENTRHNQGNAFTNAGYSNWKKQYSNITNHEKSESHINAKVAQVVFCKDDQSIHASSNKKRPKFCVGRQKSWQTPVLWNTLSTLLYIWESRDLLSEGIESR